MRRLYLDVESCWEKRWRMLDIERSTLDDVATILQLKLVRLTTLYCTTTLHLYETDDVSVSMR